MASHPLRPVPPVTAGGNPRGVNKRPPHLSIAITPDADNRVMPILRTGAANRVDAALRRALEGWCANIWVAYGLQATPGHI